MSLTVIIPTIRNGKLLEKCVTEVLRQSISTYVIFITEEPFDKFLAIFKSERVIGILVPSGTNMSTKRNLGVSKANTEYIALLDSDAYPNENWASCAVELLNSQKNVAAVCGPESGFPTETWDERIVGTVLNSFLILGANAHRRSSTQQKLVQHAGSQNLIMKRSVYTQVGGMNENKYLSEDFDFCIRLKRFGYEILFDPRVHIFHKNRPLLGFLVQRLARGSAARQICYEAIRESIKEKKEAALISPELFLVPFASVFSVSLIVLNLFGIGLELTYFITVLYLVIIAIETVRICKIKSDLIPAFLFLIFGTTAPVLACTAEVLGFDLQLKRFYRNENDL